MHLGNLGPILAQVNKMHESAAYETEALKHCLQHKSSLA